MAIPLFPFLLGAATGAAVTYMLSRGDARKRLAKASNEARDAVQVTAEKVKAAASETADKATAAAKDAAAKISG